MGLFDFFGKKNETDYVVLKGGEVFRQTIRHEPVEDISDELAYHLIKDKLGGDIVVVKKIK
jgi:hypothetical protein